MDIWGLLSLVDHLSVAPVLEHLEQRYDKD
jgi:hypothetical protein